MVQVMKMSGKYYGCDVSHLDNDEIVERLEGFANEGTPVLTLGDFSEVDEWDIDIDDVQIVPLD